MVLIWDGNAPSEKPYRTPHAPARVASSSSAGRSFKNPNDRIEGTRYVDARDGEVEPPTTQLVAVADATATLHPFYYTAIVDAFEAAEGVPDERHSPGDRDTNVGPKRVAVNAGAGIRERRNRETTERRPQQGGRRNETSHEIHGTWRQPHLGPDQDGGSASQAAGKKEVEPNAVRRRGARHALPSGGNVGILELPLKDRATMS